MKTLEHSIDIDASPGAVWAVLSDFAAFEEWNPFMTIEGKVTAVGDRFKVTIRPPNRRAMTFTPTVTEYESGMSIGWLGRFLVPRMLDGAHSLRIEPLPGGRVRFTQRETFRGILVPFMRGMLRDTDAGFTAMNEALRARVKPSAVGQ
jgi:hypothetical protein